MDGIEKEELPGTPSGIAERVMLLMSLQDEHRQQAISHGVQSLVAGMRAVNQPIYFNDLLSLLLSEKALKELDEKIKGAHGEKSNEYQSFSLFLCMFKKPGTESCLDMKKFDEIFEPLSSVMATFAKFA